MSSTELWPPLLRCQRALAASHDGFWERDLQQGTVWYSPSFRAMFGFGPDEPGPARGKVRERVHPDDRDGFVAAYEQALRTLGEFAYEVRFLDAHQRWRWVRGRGRVWGDDQGRPQFVGGAVTDIDEQKTTQLALAEQQRALEALVAERTANLEAALALAERRRQEAEQANAAKSRFLAHMSHEIRTPLNGVLGLTELALRNAQGGEQRRFLHTAHQSAQAVLQTISDVLDLSRIESGRTELQPRPFDPTQVLADTLRAAMPLARRRELLLMFDWQGEEGGVFGDAGALRQIVTNLLGNAIKFTDVGTVSLLGQAQRLDDGLVALQITVADSGPGIPEHRRAQVFEPFVQGDPGLSRGHGGAGLGLAIATRLAEAMDGRLQLHCPEGGGSVFTLALQLPMAPLPAASPAAARPGQPPLPELPPPGLAWLVYPRPEGGAWLARRLQRLGWRTELQDGVAQALAQARGLAPAQQPDLVLVAEPALDPEASLGLLRECLPGARLRLLVRPDWHDPRVEAQASALQITPMIAPLLPAQLRRIHAADHEVAEAEADLRHGDEVVLPAGAEVLLVEDNEVNQLVGQELLRALGLQPRLAADGEAALAACLQRPPALVLMDLQMPGMDGLETTRQLRRLQQAGRWPGAPIVALTAHASPEDHAACRLAGMDGVLTKPLQLSTLRRRLARWLLPPAAPTEPIDPIDPVGPADPASGRLGAVRPGDRPPAPPGATGFVAAP
ncbi:MAG: response regulator [Burkholderiaceae bacterium]|nr:response regulator [Burkholderiaceae bacterium]